MSSFCELNRSLSFSTGFELTIVRCLQLDFSVAAFLLTHLEGPTSYRNPLSSAESFSVVQFSFSSVVSPLLSASCERPLGWSIKVSDGTLQVCHYSLELNMRAIVKLHTTYTCDINIYFNCFSQLFDFPQQGKVY